MHLALMLVIAIVPSVPAETFKCPRCADAGPVLAPIVAASYDACFESDLAGPTRTATVRLDVAKEGAVSRVKVTARGNLTAAQAKCVVKVVRDVRLPSSSGGVRIQLGLRFAPSPPPPPLATSPDDLRGHTRCPPPGSWDEKSRSCRVSPCAGIPGGCRKNDLRELDSDEPGKWPVRRH
jgi:hypothetical protein